MDKIIMRGKEYKVTSNENQYDLEINGSALLLKREEEIYMTLDLDKVCLGTKLDILKNVGVVLEEVRGEQADIFEVWAEMNPGKTFDDFTAILRQTLHKHSKKQGLRMVRLEKCRPTHSFVEEEIILMSFVKDENLENATANLIMPSNSTLGVPKEISKNVSGLEGHFVDKQQSRLFGHMETLLKYAQESHRSFMKLNEDDQEKVLELLKMRIELVNEDPSLREF